MDKPDKVNAIQALGPCYVHEPPSCFYFATFAVAFYNLVSVYGLKEDLTPITQLIDITVQDIEEDIMCMDYSERYNLLAFGGKLGVTYVYELGKAQQMVVVDVDVKDEFTPYRRLNGHFKTVRQIKFRPGPAKPLVYILTGSDDFSVRLWDAISGF